LKFAAVKASERIEDEDEDDDEDSETRKAEGGHY